MNNALVHKVKTPLSDMGRGEKQAGGDLHRTQHPPKTSAPLCFSHTFSHLSSAAITHRPRPTTYTQDRMKVPSHTHYQACNEVPGAGLSLATLPLAFSQTEKQRNTGLSPGHQAKHPTPWGSLTAPGSASCPFLPFLLHITHMSHQTSYQSLQQMHLLPPAREKAATTQNCNLITVCNELTGKYFCLIRILNKLLILMSASWLASRFVPSVMAGPLLASPKYLFPSAQ